MSKPSSVAALNLGMQSITMAIFEASGGGLSLKSFARAELVADPSADSSRAGQLGIVLSELKAKLNWHGSAVACAVPSQGVFARFVKIPKVEAGKVAQMLHFEAQQNVPYPIEDVSWGYQVLPESDPDSLGALILATKLDQLEATVGALSSVGLPPDLIETSPVALYNAFRFNYPEMEGCSLLIDIGARATNLLFIEGDRLFIRTLPVGGGSITGALQKRFEGRSYNEIEDLKKTEAFIPPPGNYTGSRSAEAAEIGKIARTVMTRIHNEITRSITFYRTNQHGAAPMRVYLAGGGVTLPYTLEFFNEKLSLPIEFFNSLRRVSVASSVNQDELRPVAHCLGECAGVALREIIGDCPLEIDLKAPSLERAKTDKARRPFLIAAAALLVVAVGLAALYYRSAASKVAAINAEVASRTAPLVALKEQIDRLAGERNTMMKEAADLAAAPLLRGAWATLINELNTKLPERNVWITKLRPMAGEKVLEPDPANAGWGLAAGSEGAGTGKPAATSAITALVLDGLYLENEQGPSVVDAFVESLAQSPIFAITEQNKASVVQLRATQSGNDWAYDYKLILPLARPIPL